MKKKMTSGRVKDDARPMNLPPNLELRVLVTTDGSRWVAHCVDYDIVAQAKSLEDLAYEFSRLTMVHLAVCLEFGSEPFTSLPPAPEEIRKAYARSNRLELDFPRFVPRQPHENVPFINLPKPTVGIYGNYATA